MDLSVVLDVINESKTYIRSNNIPDARAFCENLFTEEIPGEVHFESIEIESSVVGFIKYSRSFPLPGYTCLRLLILKESQTGKGIGSKVLKELQSKCPGTLWIDSIDEELSLPFWKAKGFVQEVGRWVLSV